MFSYDNTSTFADLLKSINKRVVDSISQGLSLGEIKSVSIGSDEYSTKYPYLTAIPTSEKLTRVYTNNFADVSRVVTFSIRSIKPTATAAFGQVNGLMNNLKNLFKRQNYSDFWRLKELNSGNPIVFNTKVSEIKFLDYVIMTEGVIAEASMNIDFSCQIRTDSIKPVPSEELGETNLKETTKIIHEILTRYKNSVFSTVKTLKYGNIEPISHYPAIVVIPISAEINSRFRGSDSYDGTYNINVYTDFLNAPNSIYDSLNIIHKVRDILLANRFIFSRCFDYSLEDITFGTTMLEDIGYFTAQLEINLSSFESLIKYPSEKFVHKSNFITNDKKIVITSNQETFWVRS